MDGNLSPLWLILLFRIYSKTITFTLIPAVCSVLSYSATLAFNKYTQHVLFQSSSLEEPGREPWGSRQRGPDPGGEMGPGRPTRQAVGRPDEPRSWSKEDDGLTPLGLAAVTQAQMRGDWKWRDSMLTGPPRSSATLLSLSFSVFYSSPFPRTQR